MDGAVRTVRTGEKQTQKKEEMNMDYRRWMAALAVGWLLTGGMAAQEKTVRLKLVETSDVHGNYYPYDFVRRQPARGGLARVCAFVIEERAALGNNLLLMDNGDILQGQPTAYYYNFVDTGSTHLAADMLNYMGYDAASMGNHDVETGHPVYDRLRRQCRFPMLGANVVRAADGEPYFAPYVLFEREGVRVAVLGMITPAVPNWLPENLWKGLRFDDMVETARKWIPVLRGRERADVVVGLFHAGTEEVLVADAYRENASEAVARLVPGFDVVFAGHDHQARCYRVANAEGDSVWVVDPASAARMVADVDVCVCMKDGRVAGKELTARLTPMDDYEPDTAFLNRFDAQRDEVERFVSRRIGSLVTGVSTRPAYFGPSAFIDLIHTVQLELTGADISFAAPLSFDAEIPAGDIDMADLFNLYKFENRLYTVRMTGREIKDYLELSYARWANRMHKPDDHLLRIVPRKEGRGWQFEHFSYNFDSAAGLRYTVDVTKPEGERVNILSMADGRSFEADRNYVVAMNSYRAHGGGDLMTAGAGISREGLAERILTASEMDLRFCLMRYLEEHPRLDPRPLDLWRFVPEEWTVPASERDARLLFP